ncbi:RNA methyltransferase [Nocardioides KLBMP 9356]|uniref:RNA methyltransferase n=1 Tax=Nocardioides potassii TaxID=2911371 RepID=A0ABS9HGN5_9ACTN|nr:RNA methyltransferase [Nocardioides potassii]MCF6379542.1 RNA methyltransferase [Nocardioides potassii]
MSTPLVATNSRVKEARKLSRRSVRTERRLFLADGPKAVEGALGATTHDGEPCVVEVFATPDAAQRYDDLLGGVDDVVLVDDRAMAALSDSVSPAGVVAVCRFVDVPLQQLLETSSPPLVVCADVRDPGNAGTIIRTADAVGAGGVVLTGHSVDPHNPKTVRASVGSLFHLPVAVEPDTEVAVRRVRAAGMDVLAADGAGELDLFEIDELLADDVAWLFGNEAWGLPEDVAGLADHRVRIPIAGRAESLNLSTAAAVCLYATARAHRG